MDFQNLNHLNVLVNTLSGNLLPVTKEATSMPIPLKIYAIAVWAMEFVYLIACILGLFYVPKDKALEDGTVNIVVSVEVLLQLIYLHNRKKLVRGLIEKLNYILATDDAMLQHITVLTVNPLKKILKFYIIACAGTLFMWSSLPLVEIFKKNKFHYVDYQVPAVLSSEPFSINIFIVGVILEVFGSVYTVFRKIGLDVYTIHFILLTTAQYRYLRAKFETVLQSERKSFKLNGPTVKQEMRMLTHHYGLVVEIAVMMKKSFSPNIGLLYINNVFRFCFLSFMIVTSSAFGKVLVLLYTVGALIQLYVLCFCIQQLMEASTTVFDDAFHAKWYVHDVSLQHMVATMSLTSKLGCRLSRFRNIDLTLPSFMSILNQAYSVSLLFLKSRYD